MKLAELESVSAPLTGALPVLGLLGGPTMPDADGDRGGRGDGSHRSVDGGIAPSRRSGGRSRADHRLSRPACGVPASGCPSLSDHSP